MTVDGGWQKPSPRYWHALHLRGWRSKALLCMLMTKMREEDEVGPLRVCCYLPADTDIEETRQKIEQALWYLGRISPTASPTVQTDPGSQLG